MITPDQNYLQKMPPIHLESVKETLTCYGWSCLLAMGALCIISSYVNHVIFYYIGGILFLMPIFAPLVKKWIPKKKISPEGKAVFISGCDSGLGHMLARRLDDLGFQVFAGCLFPNGNGATDLKEIKSDRLHVVGLDVIDDISVQNAASYVKENLKDNLLWAVVCNAGIADAGEIFWTDIETIQKIMDVNTLGAVRVAKIFLSNLKNSKGRVLAIASAAARYVCPWIVPYCMSKAALLTFCDGLRLEIAKWGVQVISIEPSLTRTALTNEKVMANSKTTWEMAPKEMKDMYPSNIIDQLLKAIGFFTEYFSKDPMEVVTLIEEAIMSIYPEDSYKTGNFLTWFSLCLLNVLPASVTHILITLFLKLAECL